ncbi:MAG: hypothetical protein HW387_1082 [Parachlamydiales bacterium]|nr:hypothetical protein [Parachlamydiales bacterium]
MNSKILLKYCLIAPSGSGKSSVAKFMCKCFQDHNLRCEILKLSEPIYNLQKQFYQQAKMEINPSQQNQFLMEDIALNLRLLNPKAIINNFLERYDSVNVSVVINDDVRDVNIDWMILKGLEFRTILINASEEIRKERLSKRGDLMVSATSHLDENFGRMKPDVIIENNGRCLDELRIKAKTLVDYDISQLAQLNKTSRLE